jgi:hypothetical protein
LILKRVQHRYKEATLRSFDELRTQDKVAEKFAIILLNPPLEKQEIKESSSLRKRDLGRFYVFVPDFLNAIFGMPFESFSF